MTSLETSCLLRDRPFAEDVIDENVSITGVIHSGVYYQTDTIDQCFCCFIGFDCFNVRSKNIKNKNDHEKNTRREIHNFGI
ncbi:unnamed protein product [Arabidopsis lyrata]|nr:unnamed protein product [Arabidopsis lyrata]